MSDLISRQAVINAIANTIVNGESLGYGLAEEIVSEITSIENKGEWIIRGGRIRCKKCDSLAPIITDWEDGCTVYKYTRTQYCPNCGSDMRGEADGK